MGTVVSESVKVESSHELSLTCGCAGMVLRVRAELVESRAELTVHTCGLLQKTPMKIVEEEEEEVAEVQPDPLHQLILHFSHNALTERR